MGAALGGPQFSGREEERPAANDPHPVAVDIHPTTARRHDLDSKAVFDSTELRKRMASVLVPNSSPAE
jgi:hypothetical protein